MSTPEAMRVAQTLENRQGGEDDAAEMLRAQAAEKFLDAQIALLMNASPEELDEYLIAAGLDPQDLETRGMNAVKGALTNLQVARQADAAREQLAALAQGDKP